MYTCMNVVYVLFIVPVKDMYVLYVCMNVYESMCIYNIYVSVYKYVCVCILTR